MNKQFLTFLFGLIVILGLVSRAEASIELQFFDANYVGRAHDAQPASEGDEVSYINALITLAAGTGVTEIAGRDYDRTGSTIAGPFDPAVVSGSDRDETGNTTMTLIGTFKYVLGKYDGPNWGDMVWYFPAGITGEIKLPAVSPTDSKGENYGLSHITVFNPGGGAVPEAASIAVWTLLIGSTSLVTARSRRV